MPRLVIATSNPHKIDEIAAIFAREGPACVSLCSLKDLANSHGLNEPAETGTTFEQNATIKALSYAAQTGEWCLADDSGLEVDALRGRPGVLSSHYCTDGRETGISREERDAANNARLIRELEGVPSENRSARFVCVMVLATPVGDDGGQFITAIARGAFRGQIGLPPAVPRGRNGFGYDPLFLVAPDFARTSAELSAREKNALSHRGVALRDMAHQLRQVFPA